MEFRVAGDRAWRKIGIALVVGWYGHVVQDRVVNGRHGLALEGSPPAAAISTNHPKGKQVGWRDIQPFLCAPSSEDIYLRPVVVFPARVRLVRIPGRRGGVELAPPLMVGEEAFLGMFPPCLALPSLFPLALGANFFYS